MMLSKLFKLFCFFILSNQIAFAGSTQDKQSVFAPDLIQKSRDRGSCKKRCCQKGCHLGTAGFSTTSQADWYVIDTPVYPDTVPLSKHRNIGSTQGNIRLKSRGVKVNKSGNYSVSFTAILLNTDMNYTPLIPVFLVSNGVFDPTDTSRTIGSVVSLLPGLVTTLQVTGILQNVKAGTKLSLVATNGGSPQPEPVTVISWGISLFKIPCDPQKTHRDY